MRFVLALTMIAISPIAEAAGGKTVWPNPQISVPAEVRRFIIAECSAAKGTFFESVDDCISGEAYGYRAVVMMLVDEAQGEKAAERYRACRAGLGALGGRFHRRRAECIGGSLGYHWRFEFSRRAGLESPAASAPLQFTLADPILAPPSR